MWSSGNSDNQNELCLIDSGISDLSRVQLHPRLQVLNLHCNQIQRIEKLNCLRHLKHLDLSSNQICILQGLDELVQLRTLNLSCNQIETVAGLENLKCLVKLNLSYNQISNVCGLQTIDSSQYKLSQLELHGNRLVSLQHIQRCLEGAGNLRRLSLVQGPADNPCCRQPGYRRELLSSLPQVQVLDGTDRHGNPSDDLDILADIPGLEDYMELLLSNSSMETATDRRPTPKIDAAVDAFRHRGVATPEVSMTTTSDLETTSQSTSGQQAVGYGSRDKKKTTLSSTDHENRLEKLENLMLDLLHSARREEETNTVTSGAETSVSETLSGRRAAHTEGHAEGHAPKRDIDETDESEEDRRRLSSTAANTSRKIVTSKVASGRCKQYEKSTVTDRRKSPVRKKTGTSKGQKRAEESLIVRGRSASPPRGDARIPSRSPPAHKATRGEDADQCRVRLVTEAPTAVAKDEGLRDDIQATYVNLMKELESERERRWKAEQASKKLVDHIKQLQMRGKEEEDLQGIAVQATSRLKEALMNEREAKLRLQSDIEKLEVEVPALRKALDDAHKSDTKSRDALRISEETSLTSEKEKLQQQAHDAKKLQEATLKAAAASREVDILRNNVKSLKSQVVQMQELLASREQEHRAELGSRYSLNSRELQEVIQKQVEQAEKLHKKHTDHLDQRIKQLNTEYTDLEDEFRTALHIESSRFQELQQAYEKSSQEAADAKQLLAVTQRKDEKSAALVSELTSLVKEQKGRITELSRAKQEQTFEHKERVQTLEDHLEEARRRMVTLELLKKDKTQLEAQILAQTSLIEGLRAEKKVWGDELVNQEAGLAQDRGRMEAKIEALASELSTVKKHLDRETDAVRIKAKMVDDQTETIRKLKEGIQERDAEIKKSREETLKIQRELEEQLSAETMASQELQEKLEHMRERKNELKQEVGDLEDKVEDSQKAHSVLNKKWKEKSSLIGQLEQQVTAMKESWEGREKKLTEERDKALEAASMAVDKLRTIDDAFRRQLDNKEDNHQRVLQDLEHQKQAELDSANRRVLEVEEEMRDLLQENNATKRAMEERVKKLTRAFSELQHDLF